jgi:S-formylglutathione hydrolase FrmB
LFSKVGGHIPAVLTDTSNMSFIYLYPDAKTRESRDPISLAQTQDLKNMKVYLDDGDKDKYKFWEGCQKLNSILQARGITSEFHLVKDGDHSSNYVKSQVENYLVFYAGK